MTLIRHPAFGRRMRRVIAGVVLVMPLLAGAELSCLPARVLPVPINPFEDLEPVPLDGHPHELATTIAPLGERSEGEVIRLSVSGEGVDSVLILAEDASSPEIGVIVGGGPGTSSFDYRIPATGRYFAFVQFAPAVAESERLAVLTGMAGDPAFRPPPVQKVVVAFEDGYLTEPGLVDPESFTDEERQLLADISELARAEVMTRLRSLFDGTPVEIIDERDPAPAPPFSRLTFSPRRVLADDLGQFDTALPAVDPDSACADLVVFGELLPRGTETDPGNSVHDDAAVVYVGSFQGRGLECRSAVVESLNTIVLALSHTGAHEIGHLIGFYHVALVDIMSRNPSSAFQRRLEFARGQTLVEVPVVRFDGSVEIETYVQTTVVQDPERYFQSNFSQ